LVLRAISFFQDLLTDVKHSATGAIEEKIAVAGVVGAATWALTAFTDNSDRVNKVIIVAATAGAWVAQDKLHLYHKE